MSENNIQSQAMDYFEQLGWPTRRLEQWKYTDLAKKFANKPLVLVSASPDNNIQADQDLFDGDLDAVIKDIATNLDNLYKNKNKNKNKNKINQVVRLYFCAGTWLRSVFKPDLVPAGLTIKSYVKLNDSSVEGSDKLDYTDRPMLALNQAAAESGVVIQLEDNCTSPVSVELVYIDSNWEDLDSVGVSNYRNIIKIGCDAKLQLTQVNAVSYIGDINNKYK